MQRLPGGIGNVVAVCAIVPLLLLGCGEVDPTPEQPDATANGSPDGAISPSCTDSIQNGEEHGVDCGGDCAPCIECTDHSDCPSELCDQQTCQTSQLEHCNDVAPANATSTIADVAITWTADAGWSAPSQCEWDCNTNYDLVQGACIDEQLVMCVDNAPANATSTVTNVAITYTTEHGWTPTSECVWSCDTDFDDIAGSCINERTVQCIDTSPANATPTNTSAIITYSSAGGWTSPAECSWSCNTDFDNVNGLCLHEQQVQCADNAPANATSSTANVIITYSSGGGWTLPADCDWACNTNFDNVGGECLNQQAVPCRDGAPLNATSTITNVPITYTSGGGWTLAAECAWSCNVDFDDGNGDGSCINQRHVQCTDNAPANATSTVADVLSTYTTAGGWTQPADCSWNCDTNYCQSGDSCKYAYVEHKFERASGSGVGSVSLGVTNSGTSSRGAGQSVTMPGQIDMAEFAINMFNGFGQDVEVMLQIRDNTGAELTRVTRRIPATFTSGWMWFDIGYLLQAGSSYTFTLHLPNALTDGLDTAGTVSVAIGNDSYSGGSRYFGMTSNEATQPLDAATGFYAVNDDVEFWIRSAPACSL